MSSTFRSSPPLSEHAAAERPRRRPLIGALATAELVAIGWEAISGLLFATAVSPAVVARPWPTIVFTASLGANALLAPWLAQGSRALFGVLDLSRALAWVLALLPVVELTGYRALLGA